MKGDTDLNLGALPIDTVNFQLIVCVSLQMIHLWPAIKGNPGRINNAWSVNEGGIFFFFSLDLIPGLLPQLDLILV